MRRITTLPFLIYLALMPSIIFAQIDTLSNISISTGDTLLIRPDYLGFSSDALQVLVGQVPGLSLIKRGSDPSLFSDVMIRGNSNNFTTKPLYIIDGIWNADPSLLVADEIEKIIVLKNATETAMYGPMGANGVILIQTQSISALKTLTIDFNSNIGLNTVAKKLDLISGDTHRSLLEEYQPGSLFDLGASTDWQDEIMQNSTSQNYSLALSGRIKNSAYRISLNYLENPGIVLKSSRENLNAHLQFQQKALQNRLQLNFRVGYHQQNKEILPDYSENNSTNVFFHAFRQNPTMPVYEANGEDFFHNSNVFMLLNPIEILESVQYVEDAEALWLSMSTSYEITKNLHWHLNGGYSFHQQEKLYEQLLDFRDREVSKLSMQNANFQTALDWNIKLKNAQLINLTLGLHIQNNQLNDSINSIYSGSYYNVSNSYYINTSDYQSVYFSCLYKINKRYSVHGLINTTFSHFNSNQLQIYDLQPLSWGKTYAAISANWDLKEEKILQNVEWLHGLSLRAGFGTVGLNNVSFINPDTLQVDSRNLQPDISKEFTLGMNISLLSGKLLADVLMYNRRSYDALGETLVPVPPYSYPYSYSNTYSYSNQGIELNLSYQILQTKDLKWISRLTYYHNTNKRLSGLNDGIIYYVAPAGYFPGYASYTQRYQNNHPFSFFYLAESNGISADGAQLYRTEDGGTTRDINLANFIEAGQPVPNHEISWINNLTLYKHIELAFQLRMTQGHHIFNTTRLFLSNTYQLNGAGMIEEGIDNLEIDKGTNMVCDYYLESGTFLRMDFISLSYTLKSKNFGEHAFIKLSLSALNLFTLSNYSGLDPSYTLGGMDEFNVYPLARTFYAGISLRF